MPIRIDRFEADEGLRDLPTSARILGFLSRHSDHAFRRGEIADAIDTDPETVGTNLSRLKDRGLVRHRAPYWAITTDSTAVREFLAGHIEESRIAELLTSDDESASADALSAPATSGATAHSEAATAFVERVRTSLGDDIETLYLFGSVARGDETASSDVDVLAIIATDADYASVDDRLLDIAYDIQLEHGAPIEVHSMTAAEFARRRERGEPFVRTVLAEGHRV